MQVSITDLRANLKDVVAVAKTGEDVIVTERGIPVVRISAIDSASVIERLTAAGVLEPPESTGPRVDPSTWDVPKIDGPPISDYVRRQRDGDPC